MSLIKSNKAYLEFLCRGVLFYIRRRLGYTVIINIDFDEFTAPFTPECLFRLIRYIYETLERKFHLLYKNRELRQEYSALCRIFNFLLGVWATRLNTVNVLNITSFSRMRGDQQRWHSGNGTFKVVQYTVFHLGKRARKYILVHYVIV